MNSSNSAADMLKLILVFAESSHHMCQNSEKCSHLRGQFCVGYWAKRLQLNYGSSSSWFFSLCAVIVPHHSWMWWRRKTTKLFTPKQTAHPQSPSYNDAVPALSCCVTGCGHERCSGTSCIGGKWDKADNCVSREWANECENVGLTFSSWGTGGKKVHTCKRTHLWQPEFNTYEFNENRKLVWNLPGLFVCKLHLDNRKIYYDP